MQSFTRGYGRWRHCLSSYGLCNRFLEGMANDVVAYVFVTYKMIVTKYGRWRCGPYSYGLDVMADGAVANVVVAYAIVSSRVWPMELWPM